MRRHGATMCMAQHDLFQMIPELEAHIQPPPFQEAVDRLYKRNAWIGPAGGAVVYRHVMCSHPDCWHGTLSMASCLTLYRSRRVLHAIASGSVQKCFVPGEGPVSMLHTGKLAGHVLSTHG